MSTARSYDHLQRGHLHYLLHLLVLPMVALAWMSGEGWAQPVAALAAGVVFECLALSFHHLRVTDRGDHLRIAFGPTPLFRKRVAYAEMERVARSRSSLIEGWGIHWVPSKGWIWNIEGRDCVRIQLRSGRRLSVGSDDADGLAAFLEGRIAS